jgi:hypothetical protein
MSRILNVPVVPLLMCFFFMAAVNIIRVLGA